MMNNKNLGKNTIASLGVVAAIGTAAYLIMNNSTCIKQNKLKKNATRAMRSIGNVVNSLSSIIK